ncbi:MAG: lysophospholipid acyltransferase family protein [Patescibacteria group bacterium]
MVFPVLRVAFFPVLRFFTKRAVNIENLPKEGPYLIVCKHVGALDGFFLAAVAVPYLDKKIRFIAKVNEWGYVWKTMISSNWARVIEFLPEDRSRCLIDASDALTAGDIVALYPEGYLDELDHSSRPKTGAARLAIWKRVPIVPVGLQYDITVRSHRKVLNQFWRSVWNALKNPHSMVITFGKPFELTEYYGKEMNEDVLRSATEKIMGEIEALTHVNNINK